MRFLIWAARHRTEHKLMCRVRCEGCEGSVKRRRVISVCVLCEYEWVVRARAGAGAARSRGVEEADALSIT